MPAKSWADYKALKAAVPIREVLDHSWILSKLSERGDAVVGTFPIHKGESKTSLRASPTKTSFYPL